MSDILKRYEKINTRNYGHDEVCRLNNWCVEAAQEIESLRDELQRGNMKADSYDYLCELLEPHMCRAGKPESDVHFLPESVIGGVKTLLKLFLQSKNAEKQEPFIYVCANEAHDPAYLTEERCWKCNAMGIEQVLTALYKYPAPMPEAIAIPSDPRNGKPQITNAMKAACICEWEITFDAPYYDEDGKWHGDHQRTIDVPWSTCKQIYQRMAEIAAKELQEQTT